MAESASRQRFVPTDRPRVAVTADGTLAAIHDHARIAVVEMPSCAELSEVVIAGDAHDSAVAWVGTPPRLLVLSRFAAHSTVHLVDPLGPRTIAELHLESTVRLCAAVGNHALVIGTAGATVLTATDRGVTPYQFPARALPTTAGAAGAQLVVALPGSIEEWDPQSRLPKRRLKLPRPVTITAVGGSDRVVWMTTTQAPARVEVIPLVNRGQPKVHELPESIAHVASHPRSDLIACIGASTGRAWVVDLDGQAALRLVDPDGIDRVEAVALVLGRTAGVLAAQANRPVAVIALDRAESSPAAVTLLATAIAPMPTPTAPVPTAAVPTAAMPTAAMPTATMPTATMPTATMPRPKADWTTPTRTLGVARTWRDDLAAWAHDPSTPTPDAPLIDALIRRYDLTPSLSTLLALLYAAHMNGMVGAAPIDVARVAGWAEALGRGELADKELAIYRDSRVRLAPHVQRMLDELPPSTGTLVGTPGTVSLLGPCTMVAAGPLPIVAEACVSSIGGAILAAHETVALRELINEARAYGAAPMVRVVGVVLGQVPSDQPLILVTDDERTAEQLGVPRLT